MPQPSVDLTASVGAGPTAQSCPYGAQVGVAAQGVLTSGGVAAYGRVQPHVFSFSVVGAASTSF